MYLGFHFSQVVQGVRFFCIQLLLWLFGSALLEVVGLDAQQLNNADSVTKVALRGIFGVHLQAKNLIVNSWTQS